MSKKLKDEEAKFRNWKVKADRELMQMKNRVCPLLIHIFHFFNPIF